MTPYFEIRDDLIETLQTAWPELTKVYKSDPEIVTPIAELPYGFVLRKGPLVRVPDEGATRNFEAFAATWTVGGRFPRGDGENMDDRRIELAKILFDQLTLTVHRAGYGVIELIPQMLEIEGDTDAYFVVDLDVRTSFLLERADSV